MSPNRKWRHQFQLWREEKGSEETVIRLLRRHQKIGIDINIIQQSLSEIHQSLDSELLDPRLLPTSLLLYPSTWRPTEIQIDQLACLHHHLDLESINELLSSGILNKILRGERSLYGDLPPIPIRAYREGLKRSQREFCRENRLSALEHLATEGWQRFRQCEAVATGLDRYHPVTLKRFAPVASTDRHVLMVLDATEHQARHLAIQGGWEEVICSSLANLSDAWDALNRAEQKWVTICHGRDQFAPGARHALSASLLKQPNGTVLTCDDVVVRRSHNGETGYEHRQYRGPLSSWRLFIRGSNGGLITTPAALIRPEQLQQNYESLEAFRIDLLLQITRHQPHSLLHISEVLVKTDARNNPCVVGQGWPGERDPYTPAQLNEINIIKQRHCLTQLATGSMIRPNLRSPGCHDLVSNQAENDLISIIIPFRDRAELTQTCVESIKKYGSDKIKHEIILIDNGSTETETLSWIKSITAQKNISSIRIDEPFNFSRLNNKARSQCQGNYLLFLNNDIEFRSEQVFDQLLAPFAHPETSAVGAKLQYPDGSIQHQGVMLVKGERRTVLEPGKHLNKQEVIDSLLPLNTQEEYSAASAACLMVKTKDFDAIGGFDEKLAVVFNDVDLCLRLRDQGGRIVVTPHPFIVHHESISRGKDLYGSAWARHQRESGRLRLKHQDLFSQGDPLISRLMHNHSNRYEPSPPPVTPIRRTREGVLYLWNRPRMELDVRPTLLFAQYSPSSETCFRPDILNLLEQYRKHFRVLVISATESLLEHATDLSALKDVSDGLMIRRNDGYDYGSWMTGLRTWKETICQSKNIILTNDSFWAPVRPLDDLIERLEQSDADVIGLTDNLMYEPHLQSPFLMFKEAALKSQAFWTFWDNLQSWENKRSIVKNYEVGLPVLLRKAGLKLESLYSQNANGNILHSDWRELIINQGFPFIKVSLLRDNPHQIDIDGWEKVISQHDARLAAQISEQLKAETRN